MNPVKQKPKKPKKQPKFKEVKPEIPIKLTKDDYVNGYKALQSQWKKDKELMLVSRLAYWTYWISKLAENSDRYTENRTNLFTLKRNALILLAKSDYVQIKKYVPPIHRKMCYKHTASARSREIKPLLYLEKYSRSISGCPNCLEGEEHYYSLYSIAVLSEKEDIEGRKPLFIMNSPYPATKEVLPQLEHLESIEKYYGNETTSIDVGKLARNVNLQAFNKETIIRYFTKNYNESAEYFTENKNLK